MARSRVRDTLRTGLLTLKLPDRKIDVHFRKGNPEFVDSTHADDALATFLVREMKLNGEATATRSRVREPERPAAGLPDIDALTDEEAEALLLQELGLGESTEAH